jgi:hypothetical protein
MAIPLLKTHRARHDVAKDANIVRRLIKGQNWTFEHALRVLAAVVFYSGKSRRKRAVDWLEELLRDLMATPGEEDDTCFKDSN